MSNPSHKVGIMDNFGAITLQTVGASLPITGAASFALRAITNHTGFTLPYATLTSQCFWPITFITTALCARDFYKGFTAYKDPSLYDKIAYTLFTIILAHLTLTGLEFYLRLYSGNYV